MRVALKEGWEIPSIRRVNLRIKRDLDPSTIIFHRQGYRALRDAYPAQTRNKSALNVLEVIQGDYHKFDVFVRWPGERHPVRVQMVAFSDVHSGYFLNYRLSLTPNSHTVQLTIGDMVEQYGIPENVILDNGREFAARSISGGSQTRNRTRFREDEIPGLLTMLGTKIHWTTPYSGQSKPIERAFRDLCDRVAKHPAFAGAYTGNKPDAKPENYGNRAIPLDEFEAVLAEEIAFHNAREGRRSEVAFGTSFKKVFDAGYATSPIKRATEAQRRLWLTCAEALTAKKKNGEITVLGTNYWADWMLRIRGEKVMVRFDPDDLFAGVHVYDLKGRYLDHAPASSYGDFLNKADAEEHARKRKQFMKAHKKRAEAEAAFTAAEIAARLRASGQDAQADDLPEATVIRIAQAHPQAPKSGGPDREACTYEAPATVSNISDHREQEEDPETAFERALELEANLEAGKSLTQSQSDWLDHYQSSAKYRAFKRASGLFGNET